MLPVRALSLVIFAAMISSIHLYATYHPKIRSTSSVWVIGITCTVLADILWISLARELNSTALIAHYFFVWEMAYKLMALAIPILLFNMQLTAMGYVGIGFIVVGGIFLKWGATSL